MRGRCMEGSICIRPYPPGGSASAGSKSGISERRFYQWLIRKADERFDRHLDQQRPKRRER